MQENDRERFFALWEIVTEDVRNPPSEEKLLLYWRALKPYTIEQIELAMMAHLRDRERGQYAPKPADLVRHIVGDAEVLADRAWGTVLRAISSVGGRDHVVFEEPAIHAAIHDMGGWRQLCGMLIEEQPYRAKEFHRLYVGYKRDGVRQYPAVLTGQRLDFGQETKMIGDPEACGQTFLGGYGAEERPKALPSGLKRRNFTVVKGQLGEVLAKAKQAGEV